MTLQLVETDFRCNENLKVYKIVVLLTHILS